MATYKCDRCLYETSHTNNFKKHLARKTPCAITSGVDIPLSDIFKRYFEKTDDELRIYKCDFCEKTFKHRQNKHTHMQACGKRYGENELSELKKMVLEQQKIVLQQQEVIEELKTSINNNSNNTNSVVNSNNNTFNIQLNGFGNEKIEYITQNKNYKKFMVRCIKEKIDGVCNMILQKHFHFQHPENHNIKKLNKKDKFIDCYNGKQWNPKLLDDVIEDIFIRMEKDFATFLESIQDEKGVISKITLDAFMKKVGLPLNWDLSHGNYSFDEEIDDKKKESLKNDIYMLACEYIYRESKKQQPSTSTA